MFAYIMSINFAFIKTYTQMHIFKKITIIYTYIINVYNIYLFIFEEILTCVGTCVNKYKICTAHRHVWT